MLRQVWADLEAHLNALPAPLCEQAAGRLQAMADRNRGHDAAGYFDHPDAYPTPQSITWIGTAYLPNEPGFVERVLSASLWLFLYVRLQDDVMDEEAADRSLLLLGNICVQRGLGELHRLLADDPVFQTEAEAAWTAFSAATAWEKAEHWGRPAPFSPADLDRLGEKFAAIRLPVAAILCRAGRPELVTPYGRLLQDLGTAVQLVNDLHNWEEDLAAGNFTFFLTRAGNDPAGAIAGGVAVEECLTLARSYLARALEALPPDAPEPLRRHLTERELRIRSRQSALIRRKLGLSES